MPLALRLLETVTFFLSKAYGVAYFVDERVIPCWPKTREWFGCYVVRLFRLTRG